MTRCKQLKRTAPITSRTAHVLASRFEGICRCIALGKRVYRAFFAAANDARISRSSSCRCGLELTRRREITCQCGKRLPADAPASIACSLLP